ncbi:hypothetical protein SAMN05444395_10616 [Flavobacterium fryxellicola]|uniref:Uncharacterized protein n=1 Tax=Flavobacterium fryxellicola TaxID=249352 RepID=A0A167YH38_9FLAO|nr:hypothetical protein [Flavobacterium fryxellicola]OAB29407.1 hypothetical protein FBFR_03780 [Flavobacterium fryxellicola]SHN70752.1 hypothetical protein SAMN05444395_10616 [Flavobacterium fryxellicola]
MKALKLIAIGIILFASSTIHAQVSVNVNIGRAPSWGPVGYAEAEYYYLPDVEAYYDVRATQFIYFGSGRWMRSRYLPGQYRNYDLYGGYKVVLNDYHGSRPYSNFRNHKVKYYKGYHGREQRNIGYNHHRKVYVNDGRNDYRRQSDNHRESRNYGHDRGKGNKGHGKGKGNDHGRGHGKDRD